MNTVPDKEVQWVGRRLVQRTFATENLCSEDEVD